MSEDERSAGKQEGIILGRIETLQSSVNDLKIQIHDFTIGIGSRVEIQGKDLAVMQSKIASIITIGSWILAPAFGIVVTAILYLVIKKQ